MNQQMRYMLVILAGLMGSSLGAMDGFDPSIWGLSERQGRRPEMEDEATHHSLNLGALMPKAQLFGLFDGHGGFDSSRYAAQKLGEAFQMSFTQFSESDDSVDTLIELSFLISFKALDRIMRMNHKDSGTTALSALVTGTDAYLSWVGDSRGLVINPQGTIKCATVDHKPDSPQELLRYQQEPPLTKVYQIKDKNGQSYYRGHKFGERLQLKVGEKVFVEGPWRLGSLAISRALGDDMVKQQQPLIESLADMVHTSVQAGDIIVLACDGVWDVLSNEEVAQFVIALDKLDIETLRDCYPQVDTNESEEIFVEKGSDEKMKIIARALRDHAYGLDSGDNLSVMVIKIR